MATVHFSKLFSSTCRARLAFGACYTYNTPPKEQTMNFLRTMQPKDWMIAAVAFFAGAIIF